MAAADRPAPIEAKRALRPMRSPKAACPTRPRLIAAMAGPSTQLAAACRTRDAMTMGKTGHSPSASALMPIARTASEAAQRDQTPHGENQPDIDLRPGLGRQVHGNERTKTGLNVGHAEDEPVERATAGVRRPRGRIGRRLPTGNRRDFERDAAQQAVIIL